MTTHLFVFCFIGLVLSACGTTRPQRGPQNDSSAQENQLTEYFQQQRESMVTENTSGKTTTEDASLLGKHLAEQMELQLKREILQAPETMTQSHTECDGPETPYAILGSKIPVASDEKLAWLKEQNRQTFRKYYCDFTFRETLQGMIQTYQAKRLGFQTEDGIEVYSYQSFMEEYQRTEIFPSVGKRLERSEPENAESTFRKVGPYQVILKKLNAEDTELLFPEDGFANLRKVSRICIQTPCPILMTPDFKTFLFPGYSMSENQVVAQGLVAVTKNGVADTSVIPKIAGTNKIKKLSLKVIRNRVLLKATLQDLRNAYGVYSLFTFRMNQWPLKITQFVDRQQYPKPSYVEDDGVVFLDQAKNPLGSIRRIFFDAMENSRIENLYESQTENIQDYISANNVLLVVSRNGSYDEVGWLDSNARGNAKLNSISLPNGKIEDLWHISKYIYFQLSAPGVSPENYRFDTQLKTVTKVGHIDDRSDELYQTTSHPYHSADGFPLRYTLSVRKDQTKQTGVRPTLVSVYGGFNDDNYNAQFRTYEKFWMDRGGAIAHLAIRGGGEAGLKVALEGRKANKLKAIDDIIMGIKNMVSAGFAEHRKIALFGASNGGMLVLATVLRKPDLVGAVVAQSPLTDMLNFTTRNISGPWWTQEYGDPKIPKDREVLLKYSPLQNVRGQNLPPILIRAAIGDSSVIPENSWEMISALQNNARGGPFHLITRPNGSGHFASTVRSQIEDYSYYYNFLFKIFGMSSENKKDF